MFSILRCLLLLLANTSSMASYGFNASIMAYPNPLCHSTSTGFSQVVSPLWLAPNPNTKLTYSSTEVAVTRHDPSGMAMLLSLAINYTPLATTATSNSTLLPNTTISNRVYSPTMLTTPNFSNTTEVNSWLTNRVTSFTQGAALVSFYTLSRVLDTLGFTAKGYASSATEALVLAAKQPVFTVDYHTQPQRLLTLMWVADHQVHFISGSGCSCSMTVDTFVQNYPTVKLLILSL